MLGRMRERILNGQEWDVREAWCPEGFTRVAYDGNGKEVWEIGEANEGGVDGHALYYRTAYYNTQPSGLLYAESECKYTTRVLKINAVI